MSPFAIAEQLGEKRSEQENGAEENLIKANEKPFLSMNLAQRTRLAKPAKAAPHGFQSRFHAV